MLSDKGAVERELAHALAFERSRGFGVIGV